MNYYEIMLLINPSKPEKIDEIINFYKVFIKKANGEILFIDNWGNLNLSYPINKLYTAFYVLINIKIKKQLINELKKSFHFNESIIRSIIIKTNEYLINHYIENKNINIL